MPMKKEDLIIALGDFGYPLVMPRKKKNTEIEFMKVLAELAVSDDPRLVEGFPVLLAKWFQKGLEFDAKNFLSRHPVKSQKRRNLEKLLLLSFYLLDRENLEKPENFDRFAESLRAKWGDLLTNKIVNLHKGLSLSVERLQNALRRYISDLESSRSIRSDKKTRQHRLFERHLHLSTLFSPKQKELILKKLEGKPFTKTEKEYYSRVVKKKLDALTNSEVRKIATSLTKK